MRVLDFSPSIMRSDRSTAREGKQSEDGNSLVTGPSTIEERRVFGNDVVSTLPYHQSESPQLMLDRGLKAFAIDVHKVVLCLARHSFDKLDCTN
jgi:hypothetical protein